MADLNSNMDFTEVLKMAQNMSKNQEQILPPTLAPIDKEINNQKMRILKASLPYFDFGQQKNLAMVIKLLEFRRTMEFFNATSPVHSNNLTAKKELNTLDFLTDIKNSCDEPQQKKLNMLIMIMNMQNNMEAYKTNPKLILPIPEEKKETLAPKVEPSSLGKEDSYDQFMSMVNKIIEEKDAE